MNNEPQLHSSIIALVSLASGIAAKHPNMGLCQLDKLRNMGVPESQINTVIEIARHIREEASEKLDIAFNEKSTIAKQASTDCCSKDNTETTKSEYCDTSDPQSKTHTETNNESCCSTTPSGQACC